MDKSEIMPENVSAALFRFLRLMDEEATSRSFYKGCEFHTGLREYVFHVNPNRDENKTIIGAGYENSWTERLRNLFTAHGVRADCFPSYPNSTTKADLLLTFDDSSTLCIEIKGAWRYNLHPRVCTNPVYKKHLTSNTEGTAKDFTKVRKADSTYVGVLLIGFDAPATGLVIEDCDLELMKNNAAFDETEWNEHYDEWQDIRFPEARNRCWFWLRSQNESSVTS